MGYLFMATGNTFGGNSCPPNWEPIARARQQYAQYLWHQPNTIERAQKYLPKLLFQAEPTPTKVAGFTRATKDTLNQGVLDNHSQRRAPGYDHHVDDTTCTQRSDNISYILSRQVSLPSTRSLATPATTAPT